MFSFDLGKIFGDNHVYKVETIVFAAVILLMLYVMYSLRLIGERKR